MPRDEPNFGIGTLETCISSGPLILTFAKVPAEKGCECWNRATSVAVLTFVSYRGRHFYECQNQRDTSKSMIPVWLLTLTFL